MKTKIPDAVLAAEVSRRGLVKTTAIGGLAMASSALTLPFSRIAHAVDSAIPTKSDEKVIWSACTVNCGSRCPLRMHVVDGEIKYVETDNTGDDNYDGLHRARLSAWSFHASPRLQSRPPEISDETSRGAR
ncbi:hypothetical protein ECZU08_32340 [Escherichia coli]|nr:hypothetical protein ECZU08_32340 [Escherichia coli]